MAKDLTKLTLLIASAAVFSYVAFVWYDCSHDESCHVVYCGRKPCGITHKHVAPPWP
jgi:hypothetical protein